MKKILYLSISKFPLAGLAGAIHAGRLPDGEEPAGNALWRLPFIHPEQHREGEFMVLGEDGVGNQIYALSVPGDRALIDRLLRSFHSIFQRAPDELHIIYIECRDNAFLLAGQVLCRAAFFAPLGRLFILAGIKNIYGSLSRLVNEQKKGRGKLP